MHWYGWHSGQPRRREIAIFRDIGFRCRPNEGIGIACNQSDACGDETARILAFSASEDVDWRSIWYLVSYIGLSHSD